MYKSHLRWIFLGILCLVATLLIPGEGLSARAESRSPAEMLQSAWQNAQEAGSYRFISDISQRLIPRPVPEMIGEQETALSLTSDGAVILPDRAFLEMGVADDQNSRSVVILRDGEKSFLLQNGELKPVENVLNLASQTSDLLSYLAAADQVTLLDPPEGYPNLLRFGFIIDGPRYAEYVRQQTEITLKAEPGAPQGLTVKPLPALEQLSGQGELWINQAGLPVRQVIDLEVPEINAQYSARVSITANFSAYGKVENLPQAVQEAGGTWRLEGSLSQEVFPFAGETAGVEQQAVAASLSEPESATAWWASLLPKLPLQISPTAAILFVVSLLVVVFVLYYRRNPRRCYAIIAVLVITAMVLSPVLESSGLVRYFERKVLAAEESAAGTNELLTALGFEIQQDSEAASMQTSSVGRIRPGLLLNPTQIGLQQETGDELLERCGQGTSGVDSDSDGLDDPLELCLGTNLYDPDSDRDGIPDKAEIDGFALGETHWDSNPMEPDSNGDGIPDTLEWAATEAAPNGQAASFDVDGDAIPNLWDEDDDGDAVPDVHDLSPSALSSYTTAAGLSLEGSASNEFTSIEIQMQPEDLSHLRYTTTALDWPIDHRGNVKDLDDSNLDLRLIPYLIVTTNAAPAVSLGEKYAFRSWLDESGDYVIMAPLAPVQESGAIHSFFAKIVYAPGQFTDLRWQAQMVWMAEMQNDTSQDWIITANSSTLHEYQDSFRITGLKITKDQGYEAAVLGTPTEMDDLALFRILLGMNDTYKNHINLEGQQAGQTALQQIASRFGSGDPSYLTFGVDPDLVSITDPVKYGHMDEAVAGIGGNLVPGYLQDHSRFYEIDGGRCKDADGSAVDCASLILAYESSMGVSDLSNLTTSTSGLVDLSSLHINLGSVPLLTTRGVQMRVYEKSGSSWQITSAARMLELIEQRYKGVYDSAMRGIYPDLQADDVRFIAYTAYLLATSPSFASIAVDGQALVDETASEAELAVNRALAAEFEAEVETAIDFVGMGTGIAAALTVSGSSYVGWALNDAMGLRNDWKTLTSGAKAWNSIGVGLSVASTSASMIMGIINAICSAGSDVKMCRNEDALKVANAVVQSLAIIGQIQATVDMIIKAVKGTLDAISKLSVGIMVVGLVVGIATTWVSFAMTLAFGGMSNPVVWRNALAEAIVTTVYLVVMFILSCIPVVGQIIAAVMAIIDAIFSLFTWLFTGEAQTIATALLSLFYSAEVCTNVGDASFGEFDTSLILPDLGLVGGNTMKVSAPFEGALYEEAVGNHDDLALSSISGRLTDQYEYYDDAENAERFPSQEMSSEPTCYTSDTIKYCSNNAAMGYLLSPAINGLVPVKAVVDYTIVWAEMGGGGSWRYTTNTIDGVLPDMSEYIKPEFMYLDILPLELNDLWTWGELGNLGNPDPDGDNLTYAQETALGTSTDTWDTDGDGLSDYFEWQAFDLYATSPLDADTDFDGLTDSLEIRLGTFANVADSDSDGVIDGDEVRHYTVVDNVGAMAGGWQITMPDGSDMWISSDPLQADADHDGLTDAEERSNGLSPYALNQPVPELILKVTPMTGLASGRGGAYWDANQEVTVIIHLMNGSADPVNTPLTLDLPVWLTGVTGGTTQGDRILTPSILDNQYSWDFSVDPLLTYETVDVTLTGTTAMDASGSGVFALGLNFGDYQMLKTVSAVLDGDDPVVAILAPTDGAYLRGENLIVGGTASDATTWVESVELRIGEGGFQPLDGVLGAWSYLWDLPGDGVYTLQAQATDALAHTATSTEVSVTVDNTPPSVTLNTAVDVNQDSVQLSGSASDNMSGVAWVRLSIDKKPWQSVELAGDAWTYNWTISEGAQGDHEVKAVAYDRSGNQSSIQSATITIDAVAPSSVVTGGADPEVPPTFQPDETFSLTGVADEGGHLPLPAATADLRSGMDVFEDSAVWLGLSTIADNDGGVLAAWIGDFNADRMADLAVGLPGPEGNEGQVSVLYGRAGGWPNPPDLGMLSESPMRFIGEAGARLGSYLAAAGDTNGDNHSDLLIAGRDSTRAYLVFGKPSPQGVITLDGGQNAYRVELQTPDPVTGLAAAGDVNGDGYGDVLVHASGTAYLIFGMADPWPEILDVEAEAADIFSGSGAFGVGDTDNDQLAEWVVTAPSIISLYGWGKDSAVFITSFSSTDTAPQISALGDVNQDSQADWLYSNGADPVLVYGSGPTTNTFSGYDGFSAAPGDVDGDGCADILLTDSTGLATLIHEPSGGSLGLFATIEGVGGAANAPYAAGADLNSDGSDDLLLIPSQAAAEAKGFDAPNFSSGFISPQSLPLGATSVTQISSPLPRTATSERISRSGFQSFDVMPLLSSTLSETRYVDDDGGCEGHADCFTTIQAAVNASDGGGDRIVVYPGVYDVFTVYAGPSYDHLTIQGVSADAVFVEALNDDTQKFTPAIIIYADGVHLSNLTLRNADAGVYLSGDAGTAPSGGGNETSLDHILVHSVDMPIRMDYAGALSISDSTLVDNGVYEIIHVTSSSDIHDWDTSFNDVPADIESGGTIVSAGSEVYAMTGGDSSTIYHARPMSPGVLQSMDSSTFELHHLIPPDGSTLNNPQGTNLLVGGVNTLSQLHSTFINSNLGGEANGIIEAIAIHPTNGDVYVGGRFTTIDGDYYGHIAYWDGSSWYSLGSGEANGTNGAVLALAFDKDNNLYVGGEFTEAGNISANHLAMWDSANWSPIGISTANGLDGPVHALKYHDTGGGDLYIGGSFSYSTEYTSTSSPAPNITMLNLDCVPASGTYCFQPGTLRTNGQVNTLDLGGGYLYFGGTFTTIDGGVYTQTANYIARYAYGTNTLSSMGAGLNNAVQDVAVDQRDGHVYVASQGFDLDEVSSSESDIYEWTGATWTRIPGNTVGAYAVAIDGQGNVYTGTHLAHLKIRKGGTGDFVDFLANYQDFTTDQTNWSIDMKDLVVDSAGRLYGAIYGSHNGVHGALSMWAPPSLSRHPAGDGIWSRKSFPIGINPGDIPITAAADSSDNLYAVWNTGTANVFYFYDAAANSWTQKSYPAAAGALKHLAWAGSRLYALGLTATGWRFTSFNSAVNTWSTPVALPTDINGAAASSLAMAWDGANYIYLLRGDSAQAFLRYSLNAADWQTLADPNPYWTNISAVNGIAMTMLKNAPTGDNHFYIYATPLPPSEQSKNTYNIFSYGALPASDLRLTVDRTAFVMRDASTTQRWLGLADVAGSYIFQTDIDTSNAWIGRAGVTYTPALPESAAWQTSSAADFVAPEDGLYRLGPDSVLTAGYHQYKAVAHVYPAESACAECGSSLTWGQDAFATVREGVESGAASVLVHPGRYPQTFYLVSGVSVVGSGAESTIIEPPAGTAATLVTAEGVASASLARLTLAGGPLWNGFLAEGGTRGVTLTRNIVRGLNTGVRLRGGSEVEIVNNTILGNIDGVTFEDTSPVSLRNTILAYNSGTGLTFSSSASSVSNNYNSFWANTTDMNPVDTSLGSLFVDPRFRDLAGYDLRLEENSRLIDRGAPGDPTPPGSGERVDIGYAEQNAASFYVSLDYAESALNDGLTWGIDAFNHIQPALDAAAAAMADLLGTLPDGGYSVAVDTGTYTELVTVPSHVRLVGSGADVSILDGSGLASTVTFDGVVGSELSGFTIQNAGAGGAGVNIAGASSGILISRNILRSNPADAIRLGEQSSARVTFNTIVENLGAGLSASDSGTWADVDNNILSGNTLGLSASSNALIRSSFNVLYNTTDLNGAAAGEGSLIADPLFAGAGTYIPTAVSPAVDAADPTAEVPPAGGRRADLGYKELIASPLTLVLGPEIDSTITGNSGEALVETGIVPVTDASLPVTDTTPSDWTFPTMGQTGQPRSYWSQTLSQSSEGLYRVYSRATDAAGNLESEESDWYEGSFVIDNTAPSVQWGTPALPGTTSAAAVLAKANVSGSVTTGTGTRPDVKQVTFTVAGPSGTVSIPANNGQAWVPLPVTGAYRIAVVATDEAGNTAQQSASVSVSSASSVATVSNYTSNSGVNSTALTLRGYARFTSTGATSVSVSVDGGAAVLAVLESPGAMFSAWAAAVTLPAGEGSKSISVTPALNGTSGSVSTLTLILDTTAPLLSVDSPTTGTTVKKTVSFSGSASDSLTALAKVEVSADGGFTWQPALIASGAWSLSLDFGGQQDAAAYPVKVRAVDAASNITVVERPVTIDNMPPAGFTPVIFDVPVGQHLEDGGTLSVTWQPPVDVSGPVAVYMTADNMAETELPGTLQTSTSGEVTFTAPGDWYVHLIAQDGAGNQVLAHYGPWHVRDLSNTSFAARRHSIILDGILDLEHNEWQTNDLLGIDVRSGNPQELYLSADGQFVYMGWSGAWWTLSGVLWAYLDTQPGLGTAAAVGGGTVPGGLTGADRAVEIRSPADGVLWTWDGSTWQNDSLDFANGSSGDTEVKVPWTPGGELAMIAFALPPEEAQPPSSPALNLASSGLWALNLLGEGEPAQDLLDPWAMFPTNNGLEKNMDESYLWTAGSLADLSNINAGQPVARTVHMSVSSAQPASAALCSGAAITYDILLENPEASPISGLTLTLTSVGLTYLTVDGASLTSGSSGSIAWVLAVPELAAGTSRHIIVGAAAGGSQTEMVSNITLSAGETLLTVESNANAVLTHRLDQGAPSVGINALSGSAIAAGSNTFTGSANDLGLDGFEGSGLAGVDVSIDGGVSWTPANGTLAWSNPLEISADVTTLTLQARAIDRCGIPSAIAEQTFTVDATPPEVTWTAPAVVRDALITISGTAVDPALVKTIEIQLDSENSAWLAAASPLPLQNGSQAWHWTWITPHGDGITHNLRVRATDMVGNAVITDWQPVIVDTVAPKLSVTQLITELDLPLDPNAGPVLSGTAVDGAGVGKLVVQVIDPLGAITTQAVSVSEGDGTWAYTPKGADWLPGVYKLRVQAVDVNGNGVLTLPYTLIVHETAIDGLAAVNDSPKMVGDTVTFTASVTAGSNVVYSWDFDDDTLPVTGNPVQHAYTAAGTYTVTVTASNSLGEATATTQVTVLALSVDAGVDLTANEGATVNVSASFTGPVSGASIDWGDGSAEPGQFDVINELITGSHAYADEKVYDVTITVTDGAEHFAYDTLTVTVSNVAPEALLTNNGPVDEGSPVTVSFTNIKDPGTNDTLTYSFDWDNDGIYEIEGQAEPSAQNTWLNDGIYTVQEMVSDDDGGSTVYTTIVEVMNVTPDVNVGEDAAIDEGSVFSRDGSFTDPGMDSWSGTVDFGDGSGIQPITLNPDKTFSLSHTYADSGAYTVQVCVTDDDSQGCGAIKVTVGNVAPSVEVNMVEQTIQYSEAIEEVTFTATDIAADTMHIDLTWMRWNAAQSTFEPLISFANLAVDAGYCSTDGGINTCIWKVTGIVGMPAGEYLLEAVVTDDDESSTSTVIPIVVEPEEALVIFDGANPVALQVAKPGGQSEPFDLRVCVSERDVPIAGDISMAQIGLTLAPVGSGSPIQPQSSASIEGDGKCSLFNFPAVPVNTYTVEVKVDGGYYAGAGEDVIVIYDPSLGFTTGGGWFYWPGTENPETDYPGDRTNFGYTMKYNKKGTNIQGGLLLIRHLSDGSIYRVKSNALYGLALGADTAIPMGWASFSGKSTYFEPGWEAPVGNYEFLVYVEDHNQPGTGEDFFWIKILGGLNMLEPAKVNMVPLVGGNLVVPHQKAK